MRTSISNESSRRCICTNVTKAAGGLLSTLMAGAAVTAATQPMKMKRQTRMSLRLYQARVVLNGLNAYCLASIQCDFSKIAHNDFCDLMNASGAPHLAAFGDRLR